MRKIMFSDKFQLTRSVLEGRKTMTRRIIKDENGLYSDIRCMQFSHINDKGQAVMRSAIGFATLRPAYYPGEVVAVAQSYENAGYNGNETADSWAAKCEYPGEWNTLPGFKNKMFVQSEFMPHQIRITNVRVERMQDISDEDCLREGVIENTATDLLGGTINGYTIKGVDGGYAFAREAFSALINRISGRGTWENNPWVFVYEFELVK